MANLIKLSNFILVCLLMCKISEEKVLEFAITHWNDVNGQLESFKKNDSYSSLAPVPCEEPESDPDCVGGLANLAYWIQDTSSFGKINYTNIIRLGAGNFVGGETGWITAIKNGWFEFGMLALKHLKPDVIALGIKEFMGGLKETTTYLTGPFQPNYYNLSLSLANTCLQLFEGTTSSEEVFCKFLQTTGKVKFLNISNPGFENYQIGVIGFVDPIVERLSLPGSLKFASIIESIQTEVRSNPHIKTFIAIGDGNLGVAQNILDSVPEVKFVIYSNGLTSDEVSGKYPVLYSNRYIATAGRYGSSVGKLVLNVDIETGNVNLVNGTLIDTRFPGKYNDAYNSSKAAYDELFKQVKTQRETTIGHTRVRLQAGELCLRQGCNLGNLVADSMVHCASKAAPHIYLFPIYALWHSGSMFQDVVKAGARISQFDIHKWLPYHNKAHLVKVKGGDLKRILNASATGIDPAKAGEKDWGQFLQVSSGLEVIYGNYDGINLAPRLMRVRIVQDQNGIAKLSEVHDETKYYFVVPTFLYEGRGIYSFAKELWEDVSDMSEFEYDDNCVEGYIRALKQIIVGREGRISIITDCEIECDGSKTVLTVLLTLGISTIFLVIAYIGYVYAKPRLPWLGRKRFD